MADAEEPRFTTLAERIAALNQQKNFQAPPLTAGKRPPPPPPPVRSLTEDVSKAASGSRPASVGASPSIPPRPVRTVSEKLPPPPLPPRTTGQENGDQTPDLSPGHPGAPPLPSRNSQLATPQATPPNLPARRPSAQTLSVRRNSNASDVSQLSTVSSLSLNQTRSAPNGGSETQTPRRLPPPLEQAKLPPLPPTRRELEAKAKEAAASETPTLPPRRITEPPKPSLPPRLPSRPGNSPAVAAPEEPSPVLPARRLPPSRPAGFQAKSALECGFSSSSSGGGGRASKPSPPLAPPPIPLSSRPSIAEIDAVANRVAAAAAPLARPPSQDCLPCRDFSVPDALAAQHPTSSIPRHADPIGHLAHVLCAPLPSPTDKARAIFTWLHHNVVYDVHGFFNNCIPRGQTPADTIYSGKAVCEGYARVYEAIATRAGLECVVVTGHGKGFGFRPLRAGQPPPPRDPTGHAWNAVRIDGGRWKLVDACWGAGAVCNGQYHQRFAPECFTMSNERFGDRHFPADDRHWYRRDGRRPTWEEYMMGPAGDEPAEWMGDATREGLDQGNFAPMQRRISANGAGTVRFRFAKVCEHWLPEKNGPGKQMLLISSFNTPTWTTNPEFDLRPSDSNRSGTRQV
ncbi:hypothetical protein MYCTH_112924 [Thermothelomyces thermophilus ATCC 42464]|uniref:Transglutaminase-like domain-containing protein n=1 Tax=Thermothelomyces thermophilus (strain ATCC 42464 / BCRC 31852 / DSM 1799) TaxID=573729 RepID=G2Q5Q1_THET4|nr:uncharacterized protein MYCTH_112924 [Thermothelomyces thermophilus ATCC 42464]AEO55487.1 hypothetical protein MYCTH_112924 [Thermothelomyces thermophilus ATCC 42464]